MQEGGPGISLDGRPHHERACYNAISLHLPLSPCLPWTTVLDEFGVSVL